EGDERFLCAVGEVVDGACEDLLPGAALAGDQHVDGGAGDAARVRHLLAHMAGDDGAVAVDGQFVGGPQGGTFFAVGACLLEFLGGREQQRDCIDGGGRFDVGSWTYGDLDVSVGAAAYDEGSLGRGRVSREITELRENGC